MKADSYIPGRCNINSEEIGLRFRAAVLSFFTASIVLLFLLVFSNNRYFRLILISPIFLTVLNLIQSQQKFCIFYALGSQQNAKPGSKKPKPITSLYDRKKDRKKAIAIIVISLLFSILITIPLINISSIN